MQRGMATSSILCGKDGDPHTLSSELVSIFERHFERYFVPIISFTYLRPHSAVFAGPLNNMKINGQKMGKHANRLNVFGSLVLG